MTREESTAIYLQVADEGKEWCWHGVDGPLPRFAALVAAAEREACAQIAADFWTEGFADEIVQGIAAEIRARGQE